MELSNQYYRHTQTRGITTKLRPREYLSFCPPTFKNFIYGHLRSLNGSHGILADVRRPDVSTATPTTKDKSTLA